MSKFQLKLDSYCSDDLDDFYDLLHSHREYTDIKMTVNNDDETMMIMTCILFKFSKSIRKLMIVKYGGHLNFLTKPIAFDRLETIELYASCSTLSSEFIVNCENLKQITLDGFTEKSVKEILKKNQNIEELILYENSFITYLNLNLPNIFMNLKTFGYLDHLNSGFTLSGEFPSDEWTPTSRKMMMNFLMYQSPTLTTLRLDKVSVDDVSTIIESLPLLTNLEINSIFGDLKSLRIPVNKTIQVLQATKIHDLFLCEIVKAFKGLKTLFLNNVKTHQFIMLWENCESLKDFSYFWASSIDRINGPFVDLDKLSKNISRSYDRFTIMKTTKKKFLENLVK